MLHAESSPNAMIPLSAFICFNVFVAVAKIFRRCCVVVTVSFYDDNDDVTKLLLASSVLLTNGKVVNKMKISVIFFDMRNVCFSFSRAVSKCFAGRQFLVLGDAWHGVNAKKPCLRGKTIGFTMQTRLLYGCNKACFQPKTACFVALWWLVDSVI